MFEAACHTQDVYQERQVQRREAARARIMDPVCLQSHLLCFLILGPVRQSEIKYFVLVYFPILDRCHELQKSARIFYNITVRKPLFAS